MGQEQRGGGGLRRDSRGLQRSQLGTQPPPWASRAQLAQSRRCPGPRGGRGEAGPPLQPHQDPSVQSVAAAGSRLLVSRLLRPCSLPAWARTRPRLRPSRSPRPIRTGTAGDRCQQARPRPCGQLGGTLPRGPRGSSSWHRGRQECDAAGAVAGGSSVGGLPGRGSGPGPRPALSWLGSWGPSRSGGAPGGEGKGPGPHPRLGPRLGRALPAPWHPQLHFPGLSYLDHTDSAECLAPQRPRWPLFPLMAPEGAPWWTDHFPGVQPFCSCKNGGEIWGSFLGVKRQEYRNEGARDQISQQWIC